MQAFGAAMGWPLALCLILGLALARLGEEVLDRRAVFADLAVAQSAGLGALWGALLGWTVDDHPWSIRLFALFFALLAAALLASQRRFERRLSREALAGSLYAFSAAAATLVAAGLHHGAEEARDLLTGKTLFVRPVEVASAAGVLGLVGLALTRLARHRPAPARRARQGQAASREADANAAIRPLASDFAFWALLGVAASYAVPLVGVLLVFGFLLLPPAIGAMLADDLRRRRVTARVAAATGSVLGCLFAYARDLPLEPTVVLCLGLQLVAVVIVGYLRSSPDRLGASIGVAGTLAVATGLLAWTLQIRADEEAFDPVTEPLPPGLQSALVDRLAREPELWVERRAEVEALLAGADPGVRCRVLDAIASRRDASFLPQVHARLTDPDDLVRESAIDAARAIGDSSSAAPLHGAARVERDDFLRLALGEALLGLDRPAGLELLLDVMETAAVELPRREAFELLAGAWPGGPLAADAFEAGADPAARAASVAELRDELP